MPSGYKCFKKGLIDNYGHQYEVGKIYHVNGDIKFGDRGNGFHICSNLEDTLRYFDAMNEEIDITKVIGYGNVIKRDDEYNGFYDMYSCEYMAITKVLKRDEIITYALNLNKENVKRFISLFRLTKEEILLFKAKFSKDEDVLDHISYYQEKDLNVFRRKLKL